MNALSFGAAHTITTSNATQLESSSLSPREEMAERLPGFVQPFLTWMTARPLPGEAYRIRTPLYHLFTALLMLGAGIVSSSAVFFLDEWFVAAILPLGSILTTSGLGKLQAVIYHHCAHGTVFQRKKINQFVGRAIGIFLLVNHFDLYQKEHILHHKAKKLLTQDDEFASFIFGLCGLSAGTPKNILWRRILLNFISPLFHIRFLFARVSSCLLSSSPGHNIIALVYWASLFFVVDFLSLWTMFTIIWLLPVVVLFQLATALRVLCEHRFPSEPVMAVRDRRFIALTTAGVFAGSMPPITSAGIVDRLAGWGTWWLKMLSVHLFERLFVLVGDAPAHDYHHRHPGSRKWPSYIHEREADRAAGCPGYPVNYIENWGLFSAIDENLSSVSAAKRPLTL